MSLAVNAGEQNAFSSGRPLTIAVNKTTYPYQFENQQGQPDGLMVDLWRLWAEKQQVPIKFVLMNWHQTLAAIKDGSADIHAGLSRIKSREADFDFTASFFSQNSYIYVNKDLNNINRVEDLAPYTIGVVAESSHIEALQSRYPQLMIRTYANRHENFNAALNKEILAFTGMDHLAGGYDQYQRLTEVYPNSKRLFLNDIQYTAAVKKGNAELLQFIEQGLTKITFAERTDIERKWLGIEKDRNVLLLAMSTNLSPYMALSPAGKPQGLFVDLWRLWSERTGQKVEFIPAEMSQALKMVQQQKADVHIAYPESSTVNTGLTQAWKLYSVNSQVFVSSKYPNITRLEQLAGKTIGMFETAPYKHQFGRDYPEVKVRYFNGVDNMLAAAELGEIAAVVSAVDNFNVKLVQTNLQSSFYPLNEPVFHADIYSLVTPRNKTLAKIIDEGFQQIPREQMLAIEKKWLPTANNYYFQQLNEQLALSSVEKKWRASHPRINVGMIDDWAPMEFVDSKGNLVGINKDVLQLISERSGIDFNYQVYSDWENLYQALVDKDVDLLAGAASSEEREKIFNISKPYWSMPWVILHPQALGQQSSLRNFFGKRLAIVKGYHMISKISGEYPLISLTLVDSAQEGLQAVQQGLADGLLEPLGTASELLKKESLVTLMISVVDELQDDQEQNFSHMMMRKDWPELLSILDKGIDSISEEERQTIYERWFDINISTGFDKNTVLRLAVQGAIVLSLFIVFIIFWNRRLYREVHHRKQLEQQMKHMATHDELTGLANRTLLKERLQNLIAIHQRQQLLLAVLFIDLDGFKAINDSYGHDVGDELLAQLAKRLRSCVRQSDTLVRFGGDEFVLLLTGLHQANEAAFIAEKVLKILKTPFELSAVTTCVGCSIGIAVYPDDGETDTELVKVADTLMYRVKERGKNNYAFSSD